MSRKRAGERGFKIDDREITIVCRSRWLFNNRQEKERGKEIRGYYRRVTISAQHD